jgi:hypothetical protein
MNFNNLSLKFCSTATYYNLCKHASNNQHTYTCEIIDSTQSLDRQYYFPRKPIQIRPLPTCSQDVHVCSHQHKLVLAALGGAVFTSTLFALCSLLQQSTGLILAALGNLYFVSDLFTMCSLLQQSTGTCTCCIWRFSFHLQLVHMVFTAPAIDSWLNLLD